MAMKKNNRDYIAQMNKGMKQKLSMLLIACLLFTGYHGLTISGRAEQEEKEQTNEISVSGTQVKVQLLGEDIRRAAKEAIEKGDRVEATALQGYSGDEDLQKEYAEIFSSEKEVYEIPLDSISEGLSESLAEEEAGLQVFVERDAKDLERLVRKESKESLLLYDGNSQLSQLFPETKQGETKSAVEKKEESGAEEVHASDSNIEKTERNTELTGSELITFLYKNKADHRISFQLSVDGNTYPKVVVSPKTQLFKSFLDKLKKEEKKPQVETTVVASTEAKESTAAESAETEATASAEETEESESESAASSVSLVSTEGSSEETTVLETTVVETAEAESAEESAETKEHTAEGTEKTEATEETAAERKATETVKEKKENFTGFLQEVISHYEEFLGELETARFTQYSLNELGRKSQNVEIEGFATVEVFYDDEAFTDADGKVEEVVLEAKRLVKPEETEKEGEKLSKEQVEAMKEHSIYEGSDALDIRFVSKNDRTKEIEPKVPVSVRLTFDKKAVPEEATADTIAIHHLLESKESGQIELVETVLRSEKEKKADEKKNFSEDERNPEEIEGLSLDKGEEKDESKLTDKITKEFTVTSFSPFVVKWNDYKTNAYHGIRIYYVDRNGREIGPTRYYRLTDKDKKINEKTVNKDQVNKGKDGSYVFYEMGKIEHIPNVKYERDGVVKTIDSLIDYNPSGYLRWGLFGISKSTVGALYNGAGYQAEIIKLTANYVEYIYNGMWYRNFFSDKCEFTDFVFVYYLCGDAKNEPKPDDTTPDLKNEKYITDNLDGTYDLTLTGQSVVSGKTNKKPLDIVFVYDNTAIMSTDFDFDGTKNNTEEYSGIQEEEKKSTKVKKELKSFMEKMSSHNSVYDTRYALVTMDGMKEHQYDLQYRAKYSPSYMAGKKGDDGYRVYEDNDYPDFAYAKGIEDTKKGKFVGEFQGIDENGNKTWLEKALDNRKKKVHGQDVYIGYRQRSADFTIVDNEEDDTAYVHGFTSRPKDILSYLENLQEGKTTVTNLSGSKYSEKISGENYTAAIRNVRALLQKDIAIKANREESTEYKARDGAKKIVVFIAGGDPKYAYIQKPYKFNNEYQYDDVLRFKDQTDGIQYYRTRAWYKEGYSIGNGRSIDFPALNQARGELHQITKIDAFYSIGVGNENNWNHLNDFAMGQWYDKNFESLFEGKADLRENALVKGTLYKCFDGSEASKLNKSFDEIYKRVAVDSVQNIVFRDVLTKNVQPIMKDGKPDVVGQLVKMESNGVEVKDILKPGEMEKLGLEGFEIKAKKVSARDTGIQGLNYDGERWLLTLETVPKDFALPPGYDIRMVAKVKPTEEAEELFKSNSGYLERGEERTDLNDIYERYLRKKYPETVENDGKFNSSAGKLGLFTNEYADISYKTKKPDGSEETPNPKPYNKPIIARGSLTIEKTFKGLEGTKFLNDSTGELTDFGKKILQQLRFEVHVRNLTEIKQNGQKEYQVQELLKVNFKDDEPRWKGQNNFKEGVTFKVTGTDDLEHNVTIKIERDKENNQQLKITVDNLIPSKQYTVYEYYSGEIVGNKPKGVLDSEKGVSYQLVLDTNATNDYPIVSVGGRSLAPSKCKGQTEAFRITNKYKKEDKPNTITIKKVVTPSTKTESTESFRFYLEVFKNDGSGETSLVYNEYELLKKQLEKANPKYIKSKRDFTTGMINFKEPNKNNVMAIFFDLKDGESVQVPLNSNYKFRVYEIIKAGYDKAEIKAEWKNQTDNNITSLIGNDENNKFVYMKNIRQGHDGELITFTNPKKLAPPTGLVRDLTPYLFSIFGFTMMAGAYFAINQKKRREI